MEPKHLSYFKVENFKRFDSLEVNDIGQFNLIVGDNNVGKTSLLEALLFDDEGFSYSIYNFESCYIDRQLDDRINDRPILEYFIKNLKYPIKYEFIYKSKSDLINVLEINNKLRSSLNKEEIDSISTQLSLFNDTKLVEFRLNGQQHFIFYTDIRSLDGYYPLIPFTKIYYNDVHEFFSKWAISSSWLENFKENLKSFIPKLTSVELSNAFSKESIIILREEGIDIAQPLSKYGDGTIKLFRYLVEVDFCENKRLMIDEIEAGIHYSRIKDYLKMVIQTAKNKNVQIFATTHSKECLQYYKEALEELKLQDDARIIRLADTKHGTHSFTYNFAQFVNALLAGSEIR